MKVSVNSLTIGVTAYVTTIAGGYYWAISTGKAESEKEKEKERRAIIGPEVRKLSEAERLAVFRAGAKDYDREIGTDETVMGLNLLRRWLLSKARGDVLEVAGGTGRNLDYFPTDIRLTIIDLCEGMMAETEKKLRGRRKADVTFGVMDVNKMTFPARRFDTVVDTFGLCSFEEPIKALHEMERVTKEEGTILLLEHGKSSYDWLNRILDRNRDKHTERWGCIWNRDIEALVKEAGLEVKNLSRWHFGTTYVIEAKPSKKIYPVEVPSSPSSPSTSTRSWWKVWSR